MEKNTCAKSRATYHVSQALLIYSKATTSDEVALIVATPQFTVEFVVHCHNPASSICFCFLFFQEPD